MRNIRDPLVWSNVVYGLATLDAWYNGQKELMKLEGNAFIGSLLYHISGENKRIYMVDYIPAFYMAIKIIKSMNKCREKNKILFIYNAIHLYISLYVLNKGGYPCCGMRYKKYHTMWHIICGLGWLSVNYTNRNLIKNRT